LRKLQVKTRMDYATQSYV